MQQMRDVTGTAFVVAEFRAEENFADQPLYRDLVVDLFLSDDSRRAAAKVAAGFPHVKEMVKIRTKYFDDVLDRELASGCRQVVILGAGLDTRAVRKSMPAVTYFEIDDGATLALKENPDCRPGYSSQRQIYRGQLCAQWVGLDAPRCRLRSRTTNLRAVGRQYHVPTHRKR